MKVKSTKSALLMSFTSLLLCFAMLIGSTFAWFTDSVTSGVNKIVAGNLDVELYHASKNVTETQVTSNTANLFKDVALWEPGAYAYETFTVKNEGNLALKYKMNLNVTGKNDLNGHDLTEVIKVAVSDTVPADRAAAAALTGYTTLENWMLNKDNVSVAAGANDTFTVVLYWEPTDNDNLYNVNNTNMNHAALYLELGVNLYATQVESENDSFGTDYDKAAALPVNSVAKGELEVTDESAENAAVVKSEQTITDEKGVMSVTYPENVKLSNTTAVTGNEGAKKTDVQQKFEYQGASASSAITIEDGKSVAFYELTLPVAQDNTVAVTVVLAYTPGLTGVKIYHSGEELTATANTNGESAVYDPAGTLTLTLKHASPIDIVYDTVACTHEFENGVCTKCGEKDYAAKVNGQRYMTLGEALSNAQAGSTVKLMKDSDEDISVTDMEFTLDFNGHWLNKELKATHSKVTLIDNIGTGGIKTTGRVLYAKQESNVTVNGGNYLGGQNSTSSYRKAVELEASEMTVNNGVFKNGSTGSYGYLFSLNYGWYAKENNANLYKGSKVTVNNGTFDTISSYGYIFECSNNDYWAEKSPDTVNAVDVNGGTFTMTGSYGFFTSGVVNAVVNNCTVKTAAATAFDIPSYGFSNFKILVNGGDYTIKTYMSTWSIPLGSFAGSYPTDTAPVGKVELRGGTINSYICDGSTIGGRTSVDLVADGYHVVDNGNGTKSVVADN